MAMTPTKVKLKEAHADGASKENDQKRCPKAPESTKSGASDQTTAQDSFG